MASMCASALLCKPSQYCLSSSSSVGTSGACCFRGLFSFPPPPSVLGRGLSMIDEDLLLCEFITFSSSYPSSAPTSTIVVHDSDCNCCCSEFAPTLLTERELFDPFEPVVAPLLPAPPSALVASVDCFLAPPLLVTLFPSLTSA